MMQDMVEILADEKNICVYDDDDMHCDNAVGQCRKCFKSGGCLNEYCNEHCPEYEAKEGINMPFVDD